MPFKDMREFLAKLDEMGQLKHVKVPINVAQGSNELQTLMRLLAETNGPGAELVVRFPRVQNQVATPLRTAA